MRTYRPLVRAVQSRLHKMRANLSALITKMKKEFVVEMIKIPKVCPV